MVTISLLSGSEIVFDENLEKIRYGQDISCLQVRDVRLHEINPILLNKSLRYPEFVYSHHNRLIPNSHLDKWPQDFHFDLMSIPVGLLGIEYVKTHAFYADPASGAVSCVVQVFSGSLTLLMQKNAAKKDMFDIDTHVEEVLICRVKSGEKVAIPSGYIYTFINTGNTPLIFSRVVVNDHIMDYAKIKRESGLAYYVIAKNARVEMVANPRYRTIADVKKVNLSDLNSSAGLAPNNDVSLYDEIATEPQKFNCLCR